MSSVIARYWFIQPLTVDPITFGEPCSFAPGGLSLLEGLGPQTGDLIVQAMALDVQHMFEENLLWNVVDLAYECFWWIRFQQSFSRRQMDGLWGPAHLEICHVLIMTLMSQKSPLLDCWFSRSLQGALGQRFLKCYKMDHNPDLVKRKGYKPDGCSPSPSTSLAFTCSVNENIHRMV